MFFLLKFSRSCIRVVVQRGSVSALELPRKLQLGLFNSKVPERVPIDVESKSWATGSLNIWRESVEMHVVFWICWVGCIDYMHAQIFWYITWSVEIMFSVATIHQVNLSVTCVTRIDMSVPCVTCDFLVNGASFRSWWILSDLLQRRQTQVFMSPEIFWIKLIACLTWAPDSCINSSDLWAARQKWRVSVHHSMSTMLHHQVSPARCSNSIELKHCVANEIR